MTTPNVLSAQYRARRVSGCPQVSLSKNAPDSLGCGQACTLGADAKNNRVQRSLCAAPEKQDPAAQEVYYHGGDT
jgi:hypothetical protein